MSAGAHQTNCYGLDSGSLRLPTTQDLVDFLKLGDALDTVGLGAGRSRWTCPSTCSTS